MHIHMTFHVMLILIGSSSYLSCSESTKKPALMPEVRVTEETGGSSAGAEVALGGQLNAGAQAGDQAGAQAGDQAGAESGGQVDPPTGSEACGVELCDALDNDCDGVADEDVICSCSEDTSCYSGPPDTRGVGLCADGMRACDALGEQWLACTGSVTPDVERCDELDNDCDGLVDELIGESCAECVPDGPEMCDGVDNDCDGIVDETLTRPCPCGKTVTQAQVCNQGVWEGCEDELGRTLSRGMTTIDIPALTPNCPFNMSDNLPQEGGVFTARVEQNLNFDLPEGAQLCAFSLSGSNENFYFDDELMLLMNDVPLIGSVNFASQFEIIDGLPRYDWLRIRGRSADEVGADATCIEGAIECQIPGTQSNGEFNVTFDIPTNVRLANTSDQGTYQFKVVITGDNDEDLDCAHTGLSLQVNYEYLIE